MIRYMLGIALLLSLTSEALAQAPFPVSRAADRTRDPVWFMSKDVTVTTSELPLQTGVHSGVVDDWCIPFGSSVAVQCVLRASLCFSQSATVTIGSGTTHGTVADAESADALTGEASTTRGPCINALPSPSTAVGVLVEGIFKRGKTLRTGGREGYCSDLGTDTDTNGDDTHQRPCDDAADCGTAGTCLTPNMWSNRLRNNCAYLMAEAPSATTCTITVWR